jgi:hypothetical protein
MTHLSSASIQVFTSDLARATALCRLLGLPVAEPAAEVDHVEIGLPGGNILSFDREQAISDMHPRWTPARPAAGSPSPSTSPPQPKSTSCSPR